MNYHETRLLIHSRMPQNSEIIAICRWLFWGHIILKDSQGAPRKKHGHARLRSEPNYRNIIKLRFVRVPGRWKNTCIKSARAGDESYPGYRFQKFVSRAMAAWVNCPNNRCSTRRYSNPHCSTPRYSTPRCSTRHCPNQRFPS